MIPAKKPKTFKSRKVLENRAPKVVENTKTCLFIKGQRTVPAVTDCLKDFSLLKMPYSKMFGKRNDIHPFDDIKSIEFLSEKNDASLFVLGNHSKKRPMNITIGRLFSHHIMDMIELGLNSYKSPKQFIEEWRKKNPDQKSSMPSARAGSKPMFVFQGDEFENKPTHMQFKNTILDIFRGDELKKANLAGLDHVIVCSSVNNVVVFSHYAVQFKKSGTALPRVELQEIGPRAEFTIRRTHEAPADLWKQASKAPRELKPKKVKNISTDTFGQEARIHMPRQDLGQLATAHSKALGKKRKSGDESEESKAKKQK